MEGTLAGARPETIRFHNSAVRSIRDNTQRAELPYLATYTETTLLSPTEPPMMSDVS